MPLDQTTLRSPAVGAVLFTAALRAVLAIAPPLGWAR
jgi:hypothetical protein